MYYLIDAAIADRGNFSEIRQLHIGLLTASFLLAFEGKKRGRSASHFEIRKIVLILSSPSLRSVLFPGYVKDPRTAFARDYLVAAFYLDLHLRAERHKARAA